MKDFSFGIVPVVRTENWIEVLLVQHKSKAWHWAFPKWHSEKNETNIETAKREFEEETWISAESLDINKIDTFSTHYNFKLFKKNIFIEKTVTYFIWYLSDKFSVFIQEDELCDSSWLPLDAAIKKLTYSVDKEMLNYFSKYF